MRWTCMYDLYIYFCVHRYIFFVSAYFAGSLTVEGPKKALYIKKKKISLPVNR
jgi:hypothetical protein